MEADLQPSIAELSLASPKPSCGSLKYPKALASFSVSRAATMATDHSSAFQFLTSRSLDVFPVILRPPNKVGTVDTSAAKRRDDLSILQEMGVKSDAALPSELNIFGKRRASNLHMSTMDLLGPAHTRIALRAMGLTAAFKELEGREIRERLKLDTCTAEKFNPRTADALTEMKVMNRPMARSCSSLATKSSLYSERKPPTNARLKVLNSIMDSCDKLTLDNSAMRKVLNPLRQSLFPASKSRAGHRTF